MLSLTPSATSRTPPRPSPWSGLGRPPRAREPGILDGVERVPQSVGQALACLRVVSARLRASGDPRAVFPDVYAIITRRVLEAIEGAGAPVFHEPAFISRLAGRFCELYLGALACSLAERPSPCEAWAVADRVARRRSAWPAQDALLGVNAHINFDLALGLRDTIRAFGGSEDGARLARFRHDHDAVNAILQEALPEIFELLDVRYGCAMTRVLLGANAARALASRGMLVILEGWRARVWDDLVEMLAEPTDAGLAAHRARMDARAGRIARLCGVELRTLFG